MSHLNNTQIAEKKKHIKEQQSIIWKDKKLHGNMEEPRTKQKNTKFPAQTIQEEQTFREDAAKEQIKIWRNLLPSLLEKLGRIPDPRNPKKIKHKVTVLILMGILLFVMKISSLRDMNKTFSKPRLRASLYTIFPEIDSSPHASTLSRFLEYTDPLRIEEATVLMIKDLIRKKKFQKFYILGHLPLAMDGVQKVVRNGVLHDENWLERTIKSKDGGEEIQKYVYLLEVNITLHNGLTIPLMSEFLFYEGNPNIDKQDCELVAIKRLAKRAKSYFKRQHIVVLLDKLYANDGMIALLNQLNWKFVIVLPSHKLKQINEEIKRQKGSEFLLPNQVSFRGRKQEWILCHNIETNGKQIIDAISCLESWKEVDKDTGEVITKFSEHRWITNFNVTRDNLHEVANLGARKRWGIEDSNNTEKNRGYGYKHIFSYDWNAMRCYHYLMRLGHALNALSEFSKKLKSLIKDFGCSFILKLIKETLEHPWLSFDWINNVINGDLRFEFDWC